MKATTLVILAAGIGSRFGSLKQIEPVTPEGETILDFSIYDAVRAGFKKIVFVVRREILGDLAGLFERKLGGIVDVRFVCQDDAVEMGGRKKPYGTGHAVLSASDEVRENFCMINADDFYGRSSFMTARKWDTAPESADFSMIGFMLLKTLSKSGPVSRGQCAIDKDGFLTAVRERTGIVSENGGIYCDSKNGASPLNADTVVSMNFWGFTTGIFEFLEKDFELFLESEGSDQNSEFYINDVVNRAVAAKKASVRVFPSDEDWMGITYKEDRDGVAQKLAVLREAGVYPARLW